MADVEFTHTEINPLYVEGHGGGRRNLNPLTEVAPSYVEGHGGGRRNLGPYTEINPSYIGGGGGGWRIFTVTETNPTYKIPAGHPGFNPAFMELM